MGKDKPVCFHQGPNTPLLIQSNNKKEVLSYVRSIGIGFADRRRRELGPGRLVPAGRNRLDVWRFHLDHCASPLYTGCFGGGMEYFSLFQKLKSRRLGCVKDIAETLREM